MTSKGLNLYSSYIKARFGERVQKISIDAGFTCPNRDGSKGVGGCTFCNNDSFSMGQRTYSVSEQLRQGIALYQKKYPRLTKFIAYFQSYSNTYKEVKELERLYTEALSVKGVIGIAIGTRPDCVDQEKVKLLQELAKSYDVTVEYGVESFHDETLYRINRGHTVRDFDIAIEMTHGRGINLCTHLILGFPWEGERHLEKTCKSISQIPLDFIKIHQLQVVKGTLMGRDYEKNKFKVLTKEEYFQMLLPVIKHLPPDVVIQRLFSDYRPEYLLSVPWSESLSLLTSQFIHFMEMNHSYQGQALRLSEPLSKM